jgi:hypothetical protein
MPAVEIKERSHFLIFPTMFSIGILTLCNARDFFGDILFSCIEFGRACGLQPRLIGLQFSGWESIFPDQHESLGQLLGQCLCRELHQDIKTEEVYLWEYGTLEDVQRRIPYSIEDD